MTKEVKKVAPLGKVRPRVFIDSALWVEFMAWAKGQEKDAAESG